MAFLLLVLAGAVLLMLPISIADGKETPFIDALFVSTSAVSLTGLTTVDTATHWTFFGQLVIVFLIQIGGFGILSLTSLLGLLLSRKLSIRSRSLVAAEGRPITLGGARRTLKAAILLTGGCELLVAAILTLRLIFGYHLPVGKAIWYGIFHAVSAFNNAGFSTYSDNLVGFASDWIFLLTIIAAFTIGGMGTPVMVEMIRRIRARCTALTRRRPPVLQRFSVTFRATVLGYAVLIVFGTVSIGIIEWHTSLAGLSTSGKMISALFQGTTMRTAGFNSVDYGQMHPVALMITDALMFLGGGSAGTAGGIKVTTAVILFAAVHAEFHGEPYVVIWHRHISHSVVRQGLALATAGVAVIFVGASAVRIFDPQFTGDQVTLEVISAFGTVGLSTGITAKLTAASKFVLTLIMFLGRLGPITLVTALSAHRAVRHFDYPVERPFIG